MKDFSDISYIYEAKVIPIGSILGVLAWCSIPVVMVAGIGPVLNGELDLISYLLISMLPFNAPFISCQVRNNNLC